MSYTIYLDCDDTEPEPLGYWNYTSNCAPMWRAAGADLASYDGQPARDCLPSLRRAIRELATDVVRFNAMNPHNGWGSRASLVDKLNELRDAFELHPNATVMVHR